MKPAVFWPASAFAFVLGLALAAYGLLCMSGAAQGGAAFAAEYPRCPQ